MELPTTVFPHDQVKTWHSNLVDQFEERGWTHNVGIRLDSPKDRAECSEVDRVHLAGLFWMAIGKISRLALRGRDRDTIP